MMTRTLARWLRRLADRLDPPRPRSPFEGQSSPIYLPSPQRIGIAPERVISPSGLLEGKRLSPVDPEYIYSPRAGWSRTAGQNRAPAPDLART